MGFVEEQLQDGERVMFETRLHKVVFLWPVLLMIVAAMSKTPGAGTGFVVGFIWAAAVSIRYATSEFAVTNRRVLMKTGLISRKTMETNLSKVEGIGVQQTILGRLLDYGTVEVRGTGGGAERFKVVGYPMELRSAVQEQVDQGNRGHAMIEPVREQRNCPWCAETIQAEARICRYCQREVAV